MFEGRDAAFIAAKEPLVEVIVNGKTLSACRNVQQYFLRHTNGEPDKDAVAHSAKYDLNPVRTES